MSQRENQNTPTEWSHTAEETKTRRREPVLPRADTEQKMPVATRTFPIERGESFWQEQRRRARRSNQRLNRLIQARGGDCFAEVARLNSLGVTGHLPREIRALRGVKATRDGLLPAELVALAFEEELEALALESRNVRGNQQILEIVRNISIDIASLRLKYGHGSFGGARAGGQQPTVSGQPFERGIFEAREHVGESPLPLSADH